MEPAFRSVTTSILENHIPKRARCVVFLITLLTIPIHAYAQEDSLRIYHQIDSMTEKSKVLNWLYDQVFIRQPTTDTTEAVARTTGPQHGADRYERFRGRHIRTIEIHILEPFGTDLYDTARVQNKALERFGNKVHVLTRPYLLRRTLVLNEGDLLDPLRVSESERLLRNSPMVNDARIRVIPIEGSRDSVDLLVIAKDRWTLGAEASGDATSLQASVTERNVLGHGQELHQQVHFPYTAPKADWSGEHRIHNLDGTYIATKLGYSLLQEQDNIYLSVDRPFYSPLARWAGNLSMAHTWSYPTTDTIADLGSTTIHSTRYDLDVWGGYSFGAVRSIIPAHRSTALIVAGRYSTSWFGGTPDLPTLDTLFIETRIALISAAISVRQYSKEKYLYRFGYSEDVAEGLLITGTTGGRWGPEHHFESYLAIRATRARYLGNNNGYLSVMCGLGGYHPRIGWSDGLLVVDARYFTASMAIGKWRLRQFARLVFAKAISPRRNGGVDLNGQQLLGFEPDSWTGDWKTILKLETVFYAPWNIIGFRFAPVFQIGVGTLGYEQEPLFTRPIQPALGLGIMIRNENLIFNTFQLSLGFYPQVVPGAPSLFRWNALEQFQLRNPDLASTRPDVLHIP
ncbi:MAG: hypothetical protein KA408_07615 [Flavobacteriales bacterium]|nr:hypothetical protein [Flavobacteriales bacterium]